MTDSLYLKPIADAAAGLFAAIDGVETVHVWAPPDLGRLPAILIEPPTPRRPSPDEAELVGLGQNGWFITYPVTLYVGLDGAIVAQTTAVNLLEQMIRAIDADRGLSAGGVPFVLDSAIVEANPVVIDDRARPLFAYECELEVLKEVPVP